VFLIGHQDTVVADEAYALRKTVHRIRRAAGNQDLVRVATRQTCSQIAWDQSLQLLVLAVAN
jgi:hypothetical protein